MDHSAFDDSALGQKVDALLNFVRLLFTCVIYRGVDAGIHKLSNKLSALEY